MSVTDPEASAEADSLQESESTALAKQGSHFDPAPAGQPKSGQCGRLCCHNRPMDDTMCTDPDTRVGLLTRTDPQYAFKMSMFMCPAIHMSSRS